MWIATRFFASRKKRWNTSERSDIVGDISLLEWNVMSRHVRRGPIAARVVEGAWRSRSVASGLICGPMKRMAVHWEFSKAIPRLVTAREHADSQSR